MDAHRIFAVSEQVDEADACKTARFDGCLEADPGQFVMVWIPGEDEFPMSVSYVGDRFGITYKIIGNGTRFLSTMKPGDRIGIRGPFGRGFHVVGRHILAVAGGAGMAVIAPLVELAIQKGAKVDIVLGARTEREIIMRSRCQAAGASVHLSTDDGSAGKKGLATDIAAPLLEAMNFDSVYACGPERMIVGTYNLSKEHDLPFQASLERYIKCGIGVCDSCAIDGKHVCVDGPVFSGDVLASLDDFGRERRSPSGKRIPLD